MCVVGTHVGDQDNGCTVSSSPATASGISFDSYTHFPVDSGSEMPGSAVPQAAPASPAFADPSTQGSGWRGGREALSSSRTGLALVPFTHLAHPRRLGKGAFGDVDLMEYVGRGLMVAVKCNGTACADTAAIDNERRLYDRLVLDPHENILTVYGICNDAPDGKVRLVMKFCEKGCLSDYLAGTAKHEVRGVWCVVCGVWCVVCGAWCVVRGVLLCGVLLCGVLLCGVLVRGAWCVVRGAWCVVRGAWCVVLGEWCVLIGECW